jgi:hypothetical protein
MEETMTPLDFYFIRNKRINQPPRSIDMATFDVEYSDRSKVVRCKDYRGLIHWRPCRVNNPIDWADIERVTGNSIPEKLRAFLSQYYFLELDGHYDEWHFYFFPYDGSQSTKEWLIEHQREQYFNLGYCSYQNMFGLLLYDTKRDCCACVRNDQISDIGDLNEIVQNLQPVKKIRWMEITDGSDVSGYVPNI